METLRLKTVVAAFRMGDQWVRFPGIPTNRRAQMIQGPLRLTVTPTPQGHLLLQAEPVSEHPPELQEVEYRISLPLLNFGRILVPDSGRFYMHRFFPSTVWYQTFHLETRAIGNPFFVLMDQTERPVFAFGLLGKLIETVFEVTSPGVNPKNSLWVKRGRFRMRIRKRVRPGQSTFRDGIFLYPPAAGSVSGEKPLSWWHLLRDYGRTYQATRDARGELDPEKIQHLSPQISTQAWRKHFTLTPRAFYPAFCTWLVISSDKMTHEWVLRMGEKVRSLGIRAFILDDGWYGTGLDSLKPSIDIGDWPKRVEGKFHDIAQTLHALKRMGLNPILWFAPLAVGPDARILERARPYLVLHRGKPYRSPAGFYTLCIQNPQARALILEHVERLIAYGAGGLKVDLFDYMSTDPCEAEHQHDIPSIAEAMEILLQEIFERAQQLDPDILISVTNNHANVHLVRYASCVRGGDSPYDPNMLMLRSLYPAAYTPVVHNDYALWTRNESEKGIAHIMIRQIFAGVPNFTVDFLRMPESLNKVVESWLDFYHRFRKLYQEGEFEPMDPTLTVWERRLGGIRMITLLPPSGEIPQLDRFEELYVLNGTGHRRIRIRELHAPSKSPLEVVVYNERLEPVETWVTDRLEEIPAQEAGMTAVYAKTRKEEPR